MVILGFKKSNFIRENKNIRGLLSSAEKVLFNDDTIKNKNITGVRNLKDIKDWIGITGSLTKVSITCAGPGADLVTYRLNNRPADDPYTFSLKIIYKKELIGY